MIYNHYNLNIQSDFEIRVVHENQEDVDLLIPTSHRTLNFYVPEKIGLFQKIQFPRVYGLLIRTAKSKNNNTATIHILKNIDLNSATANFELNYDSIILYLSEYDLYCNFTISNKGE